MRVLVFGQTGQVARELARRCPAGVTARFLGRDQANLMDPDACAAAIADCDVVINAAAWTAVDKAEAEEAAATVVNLSANGNRCAASSATTSMGDASLHALSSAFSVSGRTATTS